MRLSATNAASRDPAWARHRHHRRGRPFGWRLDDVAGTHESDHRTSPRQSIRRGGTGPDQPSFARCAQPPGLLLATGPDQRRVLQHRRQSRLQIRRPRAVKYGTPRDNIFGLRAVTGDGRELRTGVYTSKGVVGLDLTRLIVGSEGTLAIITEATLKLTPAPEAMRTMRAVYASVDAATRAIARIMARPLTPAHWNSWMPMPSR